VTWWRPGYSCFSAVMGSIAAARLAGNPAAIAAVPRRTAIAVPITSGSAGWISNTREALMGHAEDGMRPAVDNEPLSEYRRVGAEPPTPIVVVQHHPDLLRGRLRRRGECDRRKKTKGSGSHWDVLPPPRAKHAVLRYGRCEVLLRAKQFSPVQIADGLLHGALRKARRLRNGLMARANRCCALQFAFAEQMQVNQKAGRVAVMAHHVAHQCSRNVFVQCYRFSHYSCD
jgi:hypothetical protein